MALTYTPPGDLGSKLPDFQLKSVDGKFYTQQYFSGSPALVVMFICNHCPYVQAIEDRLLDLARRLQTKGAKFVAICSNDPSEYPEDGQIELLKRWQNKNYPFPYLHDDKQTVAKAFGAVCTPDLFLYDQKQTLVYRGRLDDSWKDANKVTRHELENAILALLSQQKIDAKQLPAMGCSIKWLE